MLVIVTLRTRKVVLWKTVCVSLTKRSYLLNSMEKVTPRMLFTVKKSKNVMKCQAVITPDGLRIHMYRKVEGRRHYWTLYIRSEFDKSLEDIFLVDVTKYFLYGDSTYSAGKIMDVSFQGSSLSEAPKDFMKAIYPVSVTVEWAFKEIKMHCKTMDYKWRTRIAESADGSF